MHSRAKGTADHYWPWAVFFKILKFRQGSGRCPIEQRGEFPSIHGGQGLSKGRRGLAWGEGGGWRPRTREREGEEEMAEGKRNGEEGEEENEAEGGRGDGRKGYRGRKEEGGIRGTRFRGEPRSPICYDPRDNLVQ